ncbi:MAG: hypothetical protein KJN93_07795 [Alphaproteobacteria bacterium]|nr:hypothetical protein [Alphaproteobacteria bacterium]
MTDPITAKTYLEIAKLEWETGPGRYVSIATPLLVVLVGAGLAAWFDRRLKAAELRFTELTSARKDAYAEAFGHLKPTALYFPPAARAETGNQATTGRHILTPGDCEKMGAALSDWYFGEGGVLMSRRARDAYFALAHALARASVAKALHSPQVSDAKFMVDIPDLAVRQKALGIDIPAMLGSGATATPSKSPGSRGSGAAVGDWKFNSGTETDPWRDFILIQSLASAFRTRLTDDIESRIPPKDPGD